MSKNLIPEIARMLGVEIGEKFKVDLSRWSGIYYFNNNGLIGKTYTEHWIPCPELFVMIVTGNAKIIKLPWKPKEGELYYSFGFRGCPKWGVSQQNWANHPCDYALLDKGWAYRTKEEAEAALPKVAEELGVEYEL